MSAVKRMKDEVRTLLKINLIDMRKANERLAVIEKEDVVAYEKN